MKTEGQDKFTIEVFAYDAAEDFGDWTIFRDGRPLYHEGSDLLNIKEARELCEMLNKAGEFEDG